MLKIEHLSKKFKNHIVIDDINIELDYGKIYGFIGANGSGKSVFFKLLCGFLKPNKGTVLFNGKQIGKDLDFIPDLGVLIERPGFIENYNQFQNLKYLASIRNKISDDEIKRYISLVGLDINNKDKVKNFSLGMRQRLAIAQAIMEDQKIIVLDEPFNGLDKKGRKEIKNLLITLKSKDRIILLTSHIEGDIEELADSVYEFNNATLTQIF
ncbi:ABC transporter ATP-binding protein [[Eubacterium] hominis]|uniref:ABC transporter ATP-binding protein n=1 Tax=[Eubacterium] hominis TaxID=2764325 RepID=UPI003A4DFD0A